MKNTVIERHNKGIIVFLIFLVLILGGYIVYDKISNNVVDKQNDVTEINNIDISNNTQDNTLTEDEAKKLLSLYLFHSSLSNQYSLDDYKINKLSFEYNTDEFKTSMGYSKESILFLLEYDVKPSDEESYNFWSAGNGTSKNDGWITEKTSVGSINKDSHGYYFIKSIGTGW